MARRVAKFYAPISCTHVHVVDCDLQRAFGFFVVCSRRSPAVLLQPAGHRLHLDVCAFGHFRHNNHSYYGIMSASEKGNLSHLSPIIRAHFDQMAHPAPKHSMHPHASYFTGAFFFYAFGESLAGSIRYSPCSLAQLDEAVHVGSCVNVKQAWFVTQRGPLWPS